MARQGIVLYHGIDSGGELKEYAETAERCGYESLWVTERYFHEETFSMLGFLAAVTHDIKLGVGVVNPFTRNPALTAMSAATLDRISGGRFLLGLGRSDSWVVQYRMGIPYRDPRASLKETVETVRALLSGSPVTSEGGQFNLANVGLATLPVQDRLPIYLAAIGPRALRLAGAVADGVLLNAYTPTTYISYAVDEVRRAARETGRDPADVDIACMLVVRPTDDPAAMLESLKSRVVRLLDEPHVGEILLEKGGYDPSILPALRESVNQDGGRDAVSLISDDMVDSFYVVGPPERCKERIEEYRRVGVDLPLLLPRLEDYKEVATTLAVT